MGNAFKETGGLSWYPRVTDFKISHKVKRLRAEFGGGYMERRFPEDLYECLLEYIYANKGYFCEWNEDEELTWTENYNCPIGDLRRAMQLLLKRDFFDRGILEKYHVLTSRRIQINCINACAERKEIRVNADIILLDEKDFRNFTVKALKKLVFFSIKHGINPINHEGNQINPAINLQSIVEYSIVEKSKVDEMTVDGSRVEAEQLSGAVETVENSCDDDLPAFTYGNNKILAFTPMELSKIKTRFPYMNIKKELSSIQNKIHKHNLSFEYKYQLEQYIKSWLENIK